MNIVDFQRDVKEFSKEKGFAESTLEERTLFLVTEIGEVAKEVLRVSANQDPKKVAELKENLGFEIYDAVWNLFDLANKLDIDLDVAFRRKREINESRTWND